MCVVNAQMANLYVAGISSKNKVRSSNNFKIKLLLMNLNQHDNTSRQYRYRYITLYGQRRDNHLILICVYIGAVTNKRQSLFVRV